MAGKIKADKKQEPETELDAVVVLEAQLRQLLKAEQNDYTGVISRRELHRIADRIRAELRGDQEPEMGEPEDE